MTRCSKAEGETEGETEIIIFLRKEEASAVSSPPDEKMPWVKKRHDAMGEEMRSIYQNQTWTLSRLPPGKSAITTKWVYKVKQDADGNIIRHKARLVARGNEQKTWP